MMADGHQASEVPCDASPVQAFASLVRDSVDSPFDEQTTATVLQNRLREFRVLRPLRCIPAANVGVGAAQQHLFSTWDDDVPSVVWDDMIVVCEVHQSAADEHSVTIFFIPNMGGPPKCDSPWVAATGRHSDVDPAAPHSSAAERYHASDARRPELVQRALVRRREPACCRRVFVSGRLRRNPHRFPESPGS